MKRRFNYTGRKKITRDMLTINANRSNGRIASFSIVQINLSNLNLPGNSTVFLEAYFRSELIRFNCGTISRIVYPGQEKLTNLPFADNLKFRLIVSDSSTLLLLARGEGFSPQEDSDSKPLLPVQFEDLGNIVWSIIYEGDFGAPILQINSNLDGIENIARNDIEFFFYVYPAVIRNVLIHMIFCDGLETIEDTPDEWHRDWLKFCIKLGEEPVKELVKGDQFDEALSYRWIDQVVEAFSSLYNTKFELFRKILGGKS